MDRGLAYLGEKVVSENEYLSAMVPAWDCAKDAVAGAGCVFCSLSASQRRRCKRAGRERRSSVAKLQQPGTAKLRVDGQRDLPGLSQPARERERESLGQSANPAKLLIRPPSSPPRCGASAASADPHAWANRIGKWALSTSKNVAAVEPQFSSHFELAGLANSGNSRTRHASPLLSPWLTGQCQAMLGGRICAIRDGPGSHGHCRQISRISWRRVV